MTMEPCRIEMEKVVVGILSMVTILRLGTEERENSIIQRTGNTQLTAIPIMDQGQRLRADIASQMMAILIITRILLVATLIITLILLMAIPVINTQKVAITHIVLMKLLIQKADVTHIRRARHPWQKN